MDDSPKSESARKDREPEISVTIRAEGGSMKHVHKKLERAVKRKMKRAGRKSRRE